MQIESRATLDTKAARAFAAFSASELSSAAGGQTQVADLKRILILCKTYPSPSSKYAETSCVAGMSEEGQLIRLYPVPFRLISDEQQFRKWQWVEARVEHAHNDKRPESHRIYVDTIVCDPSPLKAGKEGWPHRMEVLSKLSIYDDFDAIEAQRKANGITLAFLRPKKILGLEIKPTRTPDWTAEEEAKLAQLQQQGGLFDEGETGSGVKLLEKLPFDFHYTYECEVGGTPKTYKHKLVDWEVGALYRRLRREFGASGWEKPFRAKYEQELPSRDLLLLLGTIHRFPDQWLAVSVIAPPKPQPEGPNQGALF